MDCFYIWSLIACEDSFGVYRRMIHVGFVFPIQTSKLIHFVQSSFMLSADVLMNKMFSDSTSTKSLENDCLCRNTTWLMNVEVTKLDTHEPFFLACPQRVSI